jgi:hypothetical protein
VYEATIKTLAAFAARLTEVDAVLGMLGKSGDTEY